MIMERVVKDMAISGKNKMLTIIQGGDSCYSLSMDFICVMNKITGMALLTAKLPDGLNRGPQIVDRGKN